MPIFMDRHDLSEEITPETIAQLHQQDLKIQDQFACRGLTYWFDDKRKIAFCLIEAPDEHAIHEMHSHAHGAVPNRVIEVDSTIVESFLGRIEDPQKTDQAALNIINEPAFRIIMAIKAMRLPLKTNGHHFGSLLQEQKKALFDLLKAYDGNLAKMADNYFLVSFKSVSQAVHAALDIRSLFNAMERQSGQEKIPLKIGLGAGIAVTEKESIFEDAIRLAERMCLIVKGKIILSTEVKELYSSENEEALNDGEITILTQADEKFLTLLMNHTEECWTNTDLHVNDFSKSIGCSKSQLYRKIIALTGESLNSFIKEYRLNRALLLLSRMEGNVSEIAYETGFSSPSYFSKCFQKRFDQSPSDWLAAQAK